MRMITNRNMANLGLFCDAQWFGFVKYPHCLCDKLLSHARTPFSSARRFSYD